VEIGYGLGLTRRIFLTHQVWIEDADGAADSVKLESQIGIQFDKVDVSLGYREELVGQFDEDAVLVVLVARCWRAIPRPVPLPSSPGRHSPSWSSGRR
jgi:hypothetical protein